MTFPGGIALTTVQEDYFAQSGTDDPIEASGTVTFTPGTGTGIYINIVGAGIFAPFPVVGTVNPETGLVSVELIPENADGIEPTGFSYHVQEDVVITSGSQTVHFARAYDISVPTSDDAIRLSAIAPTAPSGGAVRLVLTVNGHDPDGEGNVDVDLADVLPVGGIPESDLSSAVQTKLDAIAGDVVQSLAPADGTITVDNTDPANPLIGVGTGIPQASITGLVAALAALYTKPGGGIPESDLATALQALIDGAEQTNNRNATSGYAGLDAAQRVLAAHAPLVPQAQAVTFASTLTVDASTGSLFRTTVTANFTLAKPTNLAGDQLIQWEFTQDGTGGRTITLDAAFNLGAQTVTLSTGAGARDRLLCQYNAFADKLDVLAFGAGY